MIPSTFMAAVLLSAAAGGHAASEPASAGKPNVLFIAIDDLRTSLGCYGDPVVKSPNIDRFAAEARMFQRAYTHQAVCGPSRAAMMTGRLPDDTRVWHNRNLFRTTHPDTVTLPQLFKNHGYHAQAMGKLFSGDEREEDPASWSVPATLRAEGWKNYLLPENQRPGKQLPYENADVPDDGYTEGKLATLAIETLGQFKAEGRPFFLGVGFFKPHLPFNSPKKYWDLYDGAAFDWGPLKPRTKGAPDIAYPDHLELAGYRDIPKDERVAAAAARDLRHAYYACIAYVDAQVGRVLAELRRLGLDRNTIVVIWGDHGYSLAEADHWCKDTNFELDTRVPLMIRTPGMARPGVPTRAFVQYVDMYRTLAELAGLPAPEYLAGRSLVPILKDPEKPGREFVVSQFPRPFKPSEPEVMGYSIRTDTHRYTRWYDWPTRRVIAEELYDYTNPRSAEPRWTTFIERENVLSEPGSAATADALRAKLDQVLREHPVTPERKQSSGDTPERKKKKKRA